MSPALPGDARRLLGTSKLIALRAPANSAIGDRRSKSIGAGIEFAQYREYEPGDDLRHLDRHVYARFGKTVTRQFHPEQRLRVSVLLDASGSMAVDPASWRKAVEVASLFGVAALNGSDQVRFGVAVGADLRWGDVASRDGQLTRELERLEARSPGGGSGSLAATAKRSLEALPLPGLLVVISDWLVDDHLEALKVWHVRGQEIVAVQVLGATEAPAPGDASVPAVGWLRLVDAETGQMMDQVVDAATWRSYRAAVATWSEQVRAAVWSAEGRWLSIAARGHVDEGTVRGMRALGLVT